MRWRRAWAVTTGLLFVAWLGYLGYLAATAAHPIVLSRPQLLASKLDVIAEVPGDGQGGPGTRAVVRAVHWPAGRDDLVGKEIVVSNLPQAVRRDQSGSVVVTEPKADKWTGPGEYILPLVRGADDAYEIALVPLSPGYDGWRQTPRIYPLTDETRRQLDSIPKPGR